MLPRWQRHKRSPVVLLLLILLWSLCLGWGLAQAIDSPIGTVDPVPSRYQLGQQVYLENCATCHIALPPAVLPTDTWARLLQDPQHYGQRIELPRDPGRLLIWEYLRNFSRPKNRDEPTPYRINDSRLFKALHPQVELPQPTTLGSCLTCHVGAERYDFRSLAPEWQESP